jgi:hypothetical protein
MGDRFHVAHLRQVEGGGDQQDGVGAHGAGFVDLIGIDHEVLAQHRQVRRRRGPPAGIPARPGKTAVGQHRQAGGAVLFVAGAISAGGSRRGSRPSTGWPS